MDDEEKNMKQIFLFLSTFFSTSSHRHTQKHGNFIEEKSWKFANWINAAPLRLWSDFFFAQSERNLTIKDFFWHGARDWSFWIAEKKVEKWKRNEVQQAKNSGHFCAVRKQFFFISPSLLFTAFFRCFHLPLCRCQGFICFAWRLIAKKFPERIALDESLLSSTLIRKKFF